MANHVGLLKHYMEVALLQHLKMGQPSDDFEHFMQSILSPASHTSLYARSTVTSMKHIFGRVTKPMCLNRAHFINAFDQDIMSQQGSVWHKQLKRA